MSALVIDTDGGIDDAVALWWAATRSGVDLAAVTVTGGNVDRDTAVTNVLRVLHAADRGDVPVARGEEPLDGDAPVGVRPSPHGSDGLAGTAARWPTGGLRPVAEPAPDLLSRLTRERPGQVDLVTVGPLTTLARAVAADPGLPGRLRTLTVMGGVVTPPAVAATTTTGPPATLSDPGTGGTTTPSGPAGPPLVPETNAGRDPAAAEAVATTRWASSPLQIGSDLTIRTLLHHDDLEVAANSGSHPARFLAEPLQAYAAAYARSGRLPAGAAPGSVPCHDLLAVMAALDSSAFILREQVVEPSPGAVPWRVATEADGPRFRAAFRSLVA